MRKGGEIVSGDPISREKAWLNNGKVQTAFKDKDSRTKFESLITEARLDGRLP